MNQITLESLPDGTSLKTDVRWNGLLVTHYGVIERDSNGAVLIHHNSKRHGGAVTTDLQGFVDGSPVFVHSVPQTEGEGWLRAQRARADVECGIVWTVGNNCEDLVSRALTGRDGSPTRNAALGLGLVGLFFLFASKF